MNGADFEQKGLTPAEVVRSREEHGSNQLTHKKRNSFLRQFLSNFGDPIIKVLLVALAVNLIFLFHHFDWYESAASPSPFFWPPLCPRCRNTAANRRSASCKRTRPG